jgi:glyceraldehyde 3-phosphate dehydrogenase
MFDSTIMSTNTNAPHPIFGINGFGRIGRVAFRVWWQFHRQKMELKLINTSGSMEIEDWAHLLKYDSNYGALSEPISVSRQQSTKEVSDDNPVLGTLTIGGRTIVVTAQRDPQKIPWGANGVQTVLESTGAFTSEEKASAHFAGGAQRVIISAPAKGGAVTTSVIGVNGFDPSNKVRSNASCTTNCVAPVAQIMVQAFGVEKAMMTTAHAYTDDQNLHDNSQHDMRRARAAARNIVPTTSGAAISTGEVIPELKGLFDGFALRVPVAVGSISDMVFLTKRNTTIEEVNSVFQQAASDPKWQGILAVTSEPLVSSDIVGRRESSIVDLALTNVVGGNLVKVVSWYDNEWGYCNRLVEQIYRE